jgi:flagellar hook-basal body complex protein FliE
MARKEAPVRGLAAGRLRLQWRPQVGGHLGPPERIPMSIDPVRMTSANALDQVAGAAFGSTKKTNGPSESTSGGFADMVSKSLASVNATQSQADSLAHQYQLGSNDVSLEDAMVSMQKANISFQATVQVRNRLVQAYTDVMNMQV